jgi:hypothetical protein
LPLPSAYIAKKKKKKVVRFSDENDFSPRCESETPTLPDTGVLPRPCENCENCENWENRLPTKLPDIEAQPKSCENGVHCENC